jgi:hypothetical protein
MIIRLLTQEQLDLLNQSHLHDFARRRCRRQIRRATHAAGNMFLDKSSVPFMSVCNVLVERLRLEPRLTGEVNNLVGLGVAVDPDDLYYALAVWIIERQLQRGGPLWWDPSRRVRRRWWWGHRS